MVSNVDRPLACALEVLGAGEIHPQEPRGLEPADASDLGGSIAGRDSPSLVAFRFRAQDAQAAIQSQRACAVDRRHLHQLVSAERRKRFARRAHFLENAERLIAREAVRAETDVDVQLAQPFERKWPV